MENLDEEMKESAMKASNPRRLGGIWCVLGSPVSEEGLTGAERSELFLLPLGAEAREARSAFVESCNECDEVKYGSARLLSVRFIGQVRLPAEERSSLWSLASTLASISLMPTNLDREGTE